MTMKSLSVARHRGDQRTTLGLFVLVSICLQGASLLALLLLFGAYVGLAKKDAPSLVQIEAGKTISVSPMDTKERTPAVIQRFVQESLQMLMTASGRIPQANPTEKPVVDPGIDVPSQGSVSRKITSLARLGSFALSEDFRAAFLSKLAEQTPQQVFTNPDNRVVLTFEQLGEPEKIGEGRWKLIVIANRIAIGPGNQIGFAEPFNKEIFVRAVPTLILNQHSSDADQQIAQVRQAGLEIYAMRDYVPGNLK